MINEEKFSKSIRCRHHAPSTLTNYYHIYKMVLCIMVVSCVNCELRISHDVLKMNGIENDMFTSQVCGRRTMLFGQTPPNMEGPN